MIGAADGVWQSCEDGSIEYSDLPSDRRDITALCVDKIQIWVGGREGWIGRIGDDGFEEYPLPDDAWSFRITRLCHEPSSDEIW